MADVQTLNLSCKRERKQETADKRKGRGCATHGMIVVQKQNRNTRNVCVCGVQNCVERQGKERKEKRRKKESQVPDAGVFLSHQATKMKKRLKKTNENDLIVTFIGKIKRTKTTAIALAHSAQNFRTS